MISEKEGRRGSRVGRMLIAPILAAALVACDGPGLVEPPVDLARAVVNAGRSGAGATFTGTVDLVWPGGRGMGAPDDGRVAQAEITAFADVGDGSPGPGGFVYRVVSAEGLLHREIGIRLTWVALDGQTESPDDIRFIGIVVSDTKPCGGSGHGGEEECGDDGGCSHDDGTTHDDGSTHDDGGCGGDHEEGEPGGPGGPGGMVTGADCRIGQIVVGWALDGGTPATAGDRISWKWMAPDAPKFLAIRQAIIDGTPIPWPCKLCEKEILGGNLSLRFGPP